LVAAFVLGIFLSVQTILENSGAYRLTVQTVRHDPRAQQLLGQPITAGSPMGSVSLSGSNGRARLRFEVTGPEGSATIHVLALKSRGQWRVLRAILVDEDSGQRIDLTPGRNRSGKGG